MRQKVRVRAGGLEVVRFDGDGREQLFDECAARTLPTTIRELHSCEQLSRGDRRDRNIVLVGDDAVYRCARTFRRDDDGRIENQPFQRRSSGSTRPRTSASSSAQCGSGL
jgi:hypothetical protein